MLDPRLITELYSAHVAAMTLYARQSTADSASAEDVVHDVFVRLIGQAKSPDDPRAWLFRAVRNGAIDSLRARSRRTNREARVSIARREWFESRADDLIDAAAAQAALQSLPNEQREIVVLRLWAAMGFQQIADMLDLSVSTVFERYRAALGAMKSKLEATQCPTNDTTTTSTKWTDR